MKIQARCQCGKLTFIATKDPVLQVCCHCTDCRDASGNAFSMLAFFNITDTQVSGNTISNNYISAKGNNTERLSCHNCGTIMFDKSEGFPALIGVFTRQIAAPFTPNPMCHMWVKSKLSTTVIPEGAIQYEKGLS